MRIGLDIDGVVADFPAAYNQWVHREYGYWPAPVTRWDWYRDYPDGQQLWDEFYTPTVLPGVLADTDPYPDALDGVSVLAASYRIVFVTARPDWCQPATRAWLDRHGLDGHALIHTADKWAVPASLYVDDNTGMVARLRSRLRNAVLMDRPWNQHDNLPRVHGWGDVLVEARRAQHHNTAVAS